MRTQQQEMPQRGRGGVQAPPAAAGGPWGCPGPCPEQPQVARLLCWSLSSRLAVAPVVGFDKLPKTQACRSPWQPGPETRLLLLMSVTRFRAEPFPGETTPFMQISDRLVMPPNCGG